MNDTETLIAVISQQRNQALDALAKAQAELIKLHNLAQDQQNTKKEE